MSNAVTTELVEQKKRLVELQDLLGALENKKLDLEQIQKAVREAFHTAEDSETRDIPKLLFDHLDQALYIVGKEIEKNDAGYDDIEGKIVALEATPEVLCRCHGEVECEDQAAGKQAPTANVIRTGTRSVVIGSKAFEHHTYRGSFVFGNETASAEGTNGKLVEVAEAFWERFGFDKNGGYKQVMTQCNRLSDLAEQNKA